MATKLIGFLGIVTSILWCFQFDVGTFIDVQSLLLVAGLTFFGLLASGHSIIKMISIISDPAPHPHQLYEASDGYRAGGTFAISSGFLGVLIGLVLMLVNIEDPAAIGPAMAICLLTALYGTIIKYFLFNPIINILDTRADEIYDSKDKEE